MPTWQAALWTATGFLFMETVSVCILMRQTRKLSWKRRGILLTAYIVGAVIRCILCILAVFLSVFTTTMYSNAPLRLYSQIPSPILAIIGAALPYLTTKVGRLVERLERFSGSGEREFRSIADIVAQRILSASIEAQSESVPTFSKSVKYSLGGRKALLVATGLAVASAHPLAMDLGIHATRTVSIVHEPPMDILNSSIKLSKVAVRNAEGRNNIGSTEAPQSLDEVSPSDSSVSTYVMHATKRERNGYSSLLVNFAEGFGRIFDPFVSIPPPPAPSASTFIDSVLAEGYELALSHGYQAGASVQREPETGGEGAGSSS